MTTTVGRPTGGLSTQRYRFGQGDSIRESVALESVGGAVDRLWTDLQSQLKRWADGGDGVHAGAAERAIEYACLLAWDRQQVPTRVGLTPSGGVAFEWSDGESLSHLEILNAELAEFTEFLGTELVDDGTFRWDATAQQYRQIDG